MKKIVIYTGLRCAHCDWAVALLNKKNVNFKEYNINEDPTKREEMLNRLKAGYQKVSDYSLKNSISTENLKPIISVNVVVWY